jgi:hypothetical protein
VVEKMEAEIQSFCSRVSAAIDMCDQAVEQESVPGLFTLPLRLIGWFNGLRLVTRKLALRSKSECRRKVL